MKRTTLILEDDLLRRLKRVATDTGQTFKALVNTLLRKALTVKPTTKPYKLRWRTSRGRARQGVDVANRDALFDLMDGR